MAEEITTLEATQEELTKEEFNTFNKNLISVSKQPSGKFSMKLIAFSPTKTARRFKGYSIKRPPPSERKEGALTITALF